MRRVVICSGVLGGGTALVFALAALTASLFPHGSTVPSSMWGGGWSRFEEDAIEMAAPAIDEPAVFLGEEFNEGKP